MLSRADAALLAVVQDLVDLLQRRPVVLARWCVAAMVALRLAQWLVLGPPSAPVLAALSHGLAWLVLLVAAASDRLLAEVFGTPAVRKFVLVLAVLFIAFIGVPPVLLGVEPDPARGFLLARELFSVAYFYLASCRPPRPRPPRHVGSLAGGRA